MKTEIVLATNIFGRLEPTLRQRIKAALNNPATCWKDARNIIIDCKSMTTLWRAVCAIEPSMNNSHAVPSRETIERGLRFATH